MSGNSSKSAFFEGKWVTLSADFRGKGESPTNKCWCQKTRVIAVSCFIKISAVHHLVLSQYRRLTDRRTDRQNCDSNTVRCITCSRTVKRQFFTFIIVNIDHRNIRILTFKGQSHQPWSQSTKHNFLFMFLCFCVSVFHRLRDIIQGCQVSRIRRETQTHSCRFHLTLSRTRLQILCSRSTAVSYFLCPKLSLHSNSVQSFYSIEIQIRRPLKSAIEAAKY